MDQIRQRWHFVCCIYACFSLDHDFVCSQCATEKSPSLTYKYVSFPGFYGRFPVEIFACSVLPVSLWERGQRLLKPVSLWQNLSFGALLPGPKELLRPPCCLSQLLDPGRAYPQCYQGNGCQEEEPAHYLLAQGNCTTVTQSSLTAIHNFFWGGGRNPGASISGTKRSTLP